MSHPRQRALNVGSRPKRRRGVMAVLAAVSLAMVFAFAAFAVDTGLVVLAQTDLQNAADAAALAASQEITGAIQDAGEGNEGDPVIDASSIAVAAARQMAAEVAAANGAYIDPEQDVAFGKRTYNESTDEWDITWDAEPYNVVKVTINRTDEDTSQPNGRVKLAFGWAIGKPSVGVTVSAAAFVEARDIALVLDYSGSMNYDSQFRGTSLAQLGQTAIEENLEDIWEDLGSPTYGNLQFEPDWATVSKNPADVEWRGSSVEVLFQQNASKVHLKYTSGHGQYFSGRDAGITKVYQGTGSHSGRLIKRVRVKVGSNWTTYNFYHTGTIKKALGLDQVQYPYPSGSWDNYIDYCRDSSGSTEWYDYHIWATGYRRKFGMKTLVEFWFKRKSAFNQTPDLWKTRHYPFHAVKEGASLLCDFLGELDFGDHLGLVTYDTTARIEEGLDDDGMPHVSLGSNLITNDYTAIDTIQIHKQAAHYARATNIGGGLTSAISLLNGHGRYGARPTIVLMTDGGANITDSGWQLPANWDWAELTDYDGDGTPDYTTSKSAKLYALAKAKEAVDAGYTIHTMSVGANADRDMMEALAFIGRGVWIDIPGGSSVAEMEDQVREAFGQIAARVPPPKLVYTD